MTVLSGFDIVAAQAAIAQWVLTGSGLAVGQVSWEGQNAQRPAEPAISMRLKGLDTVGQGWVNVEINPLVITPLVVASVSSGDIVFAAPHGLALGDGPFQFPATPPAGLAAQTNYWAIPVSPTHLRLATTFLRARAASAVSVTGAGSGTATLTSTADSRRAGAEVLQIARGVQTLVLTLECYTKVGVGMGMAYAYLQRIAARRNLPSMRAILADANIAVLTVQPVRAIHGLVNAAIFEPRARVDVNLSSVTEEIETGTIIERADVTPTIGGVAGSTVRFPIGDS